MTTESKTTFDPQSIAARVILIIGFLALYFLMTLPLWRGEVSSHLDIHDQFIPWRCFYSLAQERGETGLWNPFFSRGYPHHAEGQTGILHPLHIVAYRFLPLRVAILLELALYVPFGFVGMLLFLRRSWRFEWTPCLIGAGLFAFSTFFPMHFMHVNMVWVFAHLPWALLFLERSIRGDSRLRWVTALALCVSSMILLGHPQMVWLNALGCGALLCFLAWDQSCTKTFWKRVGLVGIGLFTSLLIGALQILPTADYLLRSPRGEIEEDELMVYSTVPRNLLPNLAPSVYPSGFSPGVYYPDKKEMQDWSLEHPAYFGFWAIFSLAVGIVLLRHRIFGRNNLGGILIVAISALVFLLLSLGPLGLLIRLQHTLPLVGMFRCPGRNISLLMTMLAIVIPYVLNMLQSSDDTNPLRKHDWVVLTLLLGLTFVVPAWAVATKTLAVAGEKVSLTTNMRLAIGPMAFAFIVALFLLHRRLNGSKLVLALIGFVIVQDIAFFALPLVRAHKKVSLTEIAVARQRMRDAPHTYRHLAWVNEPVWDGHYLVNGYLGIEPEEKLRFLGEKDGRPEHLYLASVNTGHFTKDGDDFTREFSALPRARLVPNLKQVGEPLEADLLGRSDFKEFIANTALCRPDVAAEIAGPPLGTDEKVEIVDDGYDRLVLRVSVKHSRLVVLSDRWWPYWEATVDGKQREIIPLYDEMLRGIVVNPGEQEVVMTYRSKPLERARALALFGVFLLLAIAALDGWQVFRHNRSKEQPQENGAT